MNENICLSIQEEIAWGRNLSESAQLHVLTCADCGRVSLEFSKLDGAFTDADVSVPEDFTDQVMLKIETHAQKSARSEWVSTLVDRLGSFVQLRPVQVTVALWIAFSMGRAF